MVNTCLFIESLSLKIRILFKKEKKLLPENKTERTLEIPLPLESLTPTVTSYPITVVVESSALSTSAPA
jgi:hypothetical protein